jgi:hypothetical protein
MSVEVQRYDGQARQPPAVPGGRGTGGLDSIRLLQSSFHGVERRSERVIVMNDEDELMAQQ